MATTERVDRMSTRDLVTRFRALEARVGAEWTPPEVDVEGSAILDELQARDTDAARAALAELGFAEEVCHGPR